MIGPFKRPKTLDSILASMRATVEELRAHKAHCHACADAEVDKQAEVLAEASRLVERAAEHQNAAMAHNGQAERALRVADRLEVLVS